MKTVLFLILSGVLISYLYVKGIGMSTYGGFFRCWEFKSVLICK